MATAGIDGEWRPGRPLDGTSCGRGCGCGTVTCGAAPRRRPRASPICRSSSSALYGLVVAASGAIAALAAAHLRGARRSHGAGRRRSSWLVAVLQALVWCAIGALVWWWHWFRERAKAAPGAFAAVLLVIVIGARGGDHALLARDRAVRAAARAVRHRPGRRGRSRRWTSRIAAALVGAVVWVYHARVLAGRSDADAARRATRRLGDRADRRRERIRRRSSTRSWRRSAATLVDDDPRTLLLGGISALVVGAPAWWLAWRPDRANAGGCRGPGATRLPRGGVRRERDRRARHAADHRLSRLRVRSSMPEARAASWSASAPRSVCSARRPSSSATTSRSGDAIARRRRGRRKRGDRTRHPGERPATLPQSPAQIHAGDRCPGHRVVGGGCRRPPRARTTCRRVLASLARALRARAC